MANDMIAGIMIPPEDAERSEDAEHTEGKGD